MPTDPIPPPLTHTAVLAFYRDRRALHQTRLTSLRTQRRRVLGAALTLAAAIALTVLAPPSLQVPLVATLLLGIVALVWISLKLGTRISTETRLHLLYDRNLLRLEVREPDLQTDPQSPQTTQTPQTRPREPGQNLHPPGHLFERDLDLLGPDSLFAALSTVRTGPGERGLARYLVQPATHAETLLRQEAVQELLPRTELREHIALLGDTTFHQISASFFDQWIAGTAPAFAPASRIVLTFTAAANLTLILAGLSHLLPWSRVLPYLLAVLAVQGLLCLRLRARVLPLLTGGARLEHHIRLFAQGLDLLQKTNFRSPKLKDLQARSLQPANSVKLLAGLQSALSIVEQRPKEYFLLLSLLFAAGTQAAISIALWKRKNAATMQVWIDAWSEFEALNALANYAFEHPEDAWPELLPASDPPTFEAQALGHPLLHRSVPNDVSFNAANRFYLVSGSNMAGKSTLLRSVGINAALSYAGAPVRARSLRLTPLTLGASIALTDSLAEGKSKFLAEVERLSSIVQASQTAPVLFLIDEIFSGTNSLDRHLAAKAVLEELLGNGAIGALSTHDLALTDLVPSAKVPGSLVHMASPDPADPLAFDYQLKPGANFTSSAPAILRLIGLAPSPAPSPATDETTSPKPTSELALPAQETVS